MIARMGVEPADMFDAVGDDEYGGGEGGGGSGKTQRRPFANFAEKARRHDASGARADLPRGESAFAEVFAETTSLARSRT